MKSYIEKLIIENSDELQQLQNRMNYLMVEWEHQNEVVDLMQRHTGRDENIFSPRTASIINEEKMKAEKMKSDSIKREIEYVREKIESLLIKQEEYENVLKGIKTDEKEDVKEDVKVDVKIDENKVEIIKIEDEVEEQEIQIKREKLKQEEINNTCDENKSQECINRENWKEKEECDEVGGENEFSELVLELIKISKSVDVALALLNGDKNRCKNELKRVKKELTRCIDKIK